MNILIFNWRDIKHSWTGGSEVYIYELAKRWAAQGHNVTMFCGQDKEKPLKPYEIISKVHVYRRGSQFSVYFWGVYYYLLKLRNKADVVIDTENGIPFFTPLFSRKPKICIVFHVHRKQFFYELPFPLNLVGFITERFIFPAIYSRTKIIAISKTTKNELVKIGFNPKRIKIVYSGIEKNNHINKNKKFSKPTIIYLGRIKKYKRVDILIKVMPQIMEKCPNARLIIAGWGTEAPLIIDNVMKGKVRRHIDILGPVSDYEKKTLLSKSWVFINPSIGEGWSIAVIEANLHGTPAIAFDVPGLSESIQTDNTGYLVTTEIDLVDRAVNILNNQKLRSKLSNNARKWAESFSWDKAAKECLDLIGYKHKLKTKTRVRGAL